ncbi:MAG: hypothetical protein HRU09_08160 [Oligoflexales bacterium]|nr:hypothetical protein [Oligoflexales bacterium]
MKKYPLCVILPRTLEHLVAFLALSLLVSCVHNKITKEESFLPTQELKAETILASPMQWSLPESLPEHLLIPSDILALYKVVSSHVELRQGPGTAYPINDQLLSYDSLVLVIENSGVWRKIAVLDSNLSGWVHNRQIKKTLVKNLTVIKVPTRFFPVVRTVKKVKRIKDYSDKKRIKVQIPTDTPLLRLNSGKKGVLVWLSHTNSVAWLSKNSSF